MMKPMSVLSHFSLRALLLPALSVPLFAETARAQEPATPETAAPTAQAPKLPYMQRYVPEGNAWELGMFGGVLFPSSSHELREPGTGLVEQPYKTAGVVGIRVAYLPLSFLGVEAEAAAMPTSADDGTSAGLWGARAHLLGQFPGASVIPFGVLGVGVLGAASDAMGSDSDPAFHFGVGVKASLDEHVLFRLDVRDNLTQKVDVAQGRLTHHPEITLGVSFVPERRLPDTDADGFADHRDLCPMQAGEVDGCPAAPAVPETPPPCDAPAEPAPPVVEEEAVPPPVEEPASDEETPKEGDDGSEGEGEDSTPPEEQPAPLPETAPEAT